MRIETLLARLREGDEDARKELFPLIYAELHGLAQAQMVRQSPAHTLQPTALVNEAYVKLCKPEAGAWEDRGHFLRLASIAMRQVLIDHARAKTRRKRENIGEKVSLDGLVDEYERRSGGLLALDAALERMASRSPEMVELIELRFFGGRSMAEVAAALGITLRTAERRWRTARVILQRELEE